MPISTSSTPSTSTMPAKPPLPRSPRRHHTPYYLLPLISSLSWTITLWILLIYWLSTSRPHYTSMSASQTIAYISDVGADRLKPLFIVGCSITAVGFVGALAATRRNHRLVRRLERWMDWLSVGASVVGAVGLVGLSSMDTRRWPTWHRSWLAVFMIGVVFSAIFTAIEYRRLERTYRDHTMILRYSYIFKVFIIIVEVALSIAFGTLMRVKKHNAAAIVEWLISFIFAFYLLSFMVDLHPRSRTKELITADEEGPAGGHGMGEGSLMNPLASSEDERRLFRGEGAGVPVEMREREGRRESGMVV